MRAHGTLRWIAGAMIWATFMIAHPAHPQNAEGEANLVLLYGVQFVELPDYGRRSLVRMH